MLSAANAFPHVHNLNWPDSWKDTWVRALLTRLLPQELKREAHKPDQAESLCCKTLWLLLWKPGRQTWHLSVLLVPSGHQDSGNLLMVFVHHCVQRNKKNRMCTPHRYLVIYLLASVFLRIIATSHPADWSLQAVMQLNTVLNYWN